LVNLGGPRSVKVTPWRRQVVLELASESDKKGILIMKLHGYYQGLAGQEPGTSDAEYLTEEDT